VSIVEHAEGSARASQARTALRLAVQHIDRAPHPLHPPHRRRAGAVAGDPRRALVPRGLVRGRWQALSRARPTPEARPADRRQTPTRREIQVLDQLALGHPNKLIAFHLGVTPSTVATLLTRAGRKLGCMNGRQLVVLARQRLAAPTRIPEAGIIIFAQTSSLVAWHGVAELRAPHHGPAQSRPRHPGQRGLHGAPAHRVA